MEQASDLSTSSPAKSKSFVREVIETILLTAFIFVGVNFFTGRFKIFGASMDNTFQHGQFILVNRLAYQFSRPQRGEVVVFVPPGHEPGTFVERLTGMAGETDFIKRVVGLPGDTIEIGHDGVLKLNGAPLFEPYINEPMRPTYTGFWQLGDDEYFVLGDNRNFSKDSRDASIGAIPLDRIIGRVEAVYWPITDWKLVEHYRYP